MEILTKPFMPFSMYKLIEKESEYEIYLKGGKITYLPKSINIDTDISWLLGIWMGDNYSSKKGTKPTKSKINTSGRFGVINNDLDIVERVIKIFKKMKLKNIKIDIILPKSNNVQVNDIKEKFKEFNPNIYSGSQWRKEIGISVYVNNTSFLRVFNSLAKEIKHLNKWEMSSIISGLIDSEGNIDKSNKHIKITNKDKGIQKIIEQSLDRLKIDYKVEFDKRDQYRNIIKGKYNLKKLDRWINLGSKRKSKLLKEMLEGNFVRNVDMDYFKKFKKDLKDETTILDLSTKYNIPIPTVKMILRNLNSINIVKRKVEGRRYIYYI